MKTDRQLIERLLELQEHPEQVTDEQLQQALDDPQMRELVEQMAALGSAALLCKELRRGKRNTARLSIQEDGRFVYRRTPCVGHGVCGYPHRADGQQP